MTGFWSFEKLLRRTLSLLPDAPLILEWGPGYSTGIMVQVKPRATVHSIEHDDYWAKVAVDRFKEYPQITVYFEPNFPDYWLKARELSDKLGKFDLVFVDGTNRIECLQVTRDVVKPEGWVLLHDSERAEYRAGWELFRVVQEEEDTKAMVTK